MDRARLEEHIATVAQGKDPKAVNAAFGVIAKQFKPMIERLSMRWTRPDMDREDFRQLALMGIYDGCRTYKPGLGTIGGYFWRVAFHTIVTYSIANTKHKGRDTHVASIEARNDDGLRIADLLHTTGQELKAVENLDLLSFYLRELYPLLSDFQKEALCALIEDVYGATRADQMRIAEKLLGNCNNMRAVDNVLYKVRAMAANVAENTAAAGMVD